MSIYWVCGVWLWHSHCQTGSPWSTSHRTDREVTEPHDPLLASSPCLTYGRLYWDWRRIFCPSDLHFWKGARRHAVSPSLPIWGSRYSATVTCCSMQGNFVIPNSWFYVIFPSWYKSLRRFSYNQLPILWRELSAFQKSSSHTLTFVGHSVTLDLSRHFFNSQWTPSGDAFIIGSDLERLESETLPQYFRHNRFQSLVRQVRAKHF